MSRRVEVWEADEPFVAIASVAWEDDYLESITDRREKYGPIYVMHLEARKRMRNRWEGFRFAEAIEERVESIESAALGILKRVADIRKGLRE